MSADGGISLRIQPRRLLPPRDPTNLPPRNSRVGDTMVIREQRFSSDQVRQVLGDVLGA